MESIESKRIKSLIKNFIKRRGFHHIDLAKALKVSLPTARRILSKDDLSVSRIVAICDWLGISFFDLMELAKQEGLTREEDFTEQQEDFFASFPQYYSYFRCLGQGLSPKEIEAKYHISKRSSEKYLTELEILGLISRSQVDRQKLNVKWPIYWRFPGKLQANFGRSLFSGLIDKLIAKTSDTLNQVKFGKTYFFLLDSPQLRQSTYEAYVKEARSLQRKYTAISHFECQTEDPANLRQCAALFGIDQIDCFASALGEVTEL